MADLAALKDAVAANHDAVTALIHKYEDLKAQLLAAQTPADFGDIVAQLQADDAAAAAVDAPAPAPEPAPVEPAPPADAPPAQ
jgi:hypothetical protein